jgi:hypothetical protein
MPAKYFRHSVSNRSLIVLANAVLYVALVSYGNQKVREWHVEIRALESRGISIDLRWWTPWSTAIAHGVNLPAVLPCYIAFALMRFPQPDPIEPAQESAIILAIASMFWWFGIPFAENQYYLCRQSARGQRVWKVIAASLACILLSLAGLWGLRQRFDKVPSGQALTAFQSGLEAGHTLEWMFLLIWIVCGVHLATARALARHN